MTVNHRVTIRVRVIRRESNSSRICVAQKRGNHRDEPGGGLFQQALATVARVMQSWG